MSIRIFILLLLFDFERHSDFSFLCSSKEIVALIFPA